jgi:hypothetical protein
MLDVFKTPFQGFVAADFVCYTQDKWASRLHNRARMAVVDKLNAIGRQAQSHLAGLSPPLAISAETNQPIPNVFNNHSVDAQWLYLTRDAEARRSLSSLIDREHSAAENLRDAAPYKRHLMLAVKVHEGGVDVLLGLHRHASVDARNAIRKLSEPGEAAAFDALLAQLGEEVGDLHLVGPLGVLGIGECSAAAFRAQLEALGEEQEWFILGRNAAPNEPAVSDPSFVGEICGLLGALAPLYRFLLWSHENDFAAVGEALGAPAATSAPVVSAAPAGIEAGAQVRITAGLFQGRTGVVEEIEGESGMARVKLGSMAIQVKVQALEPL